MSTSDRQLKLGKRIAELRYAERLSLRRLALIVGTGHSHLMKIEKGEIDVRYSLLCRIADGLGVRVGELTDGSGVEDER